MEWCANSGAAARSRIESNGLLDIKNRPDRNDTLPGRGKIVVLVVTAAVGSAATAGSAASIAARATGGSATAAGWRGAAVVSASTILTGCRWS